MLSFRVQLNNDGSRYLYVDEDGVINNIQIAPDDVDPMSDPKARFDWMVKLMKDANVIPADRELTLNITPKPTESPPGPPA